jgi:hypothetical protein
MPDPSAFVAAGGFSLYYLIDKNSVPVDPLFSDMGGLELSTNVGRQIKLVQGNPITTPLYSPGASFSGSLGSSGGPGQVATIPESNPVPSKSVVSLHYTYGGAPGGTWETRVDGAHARSAPPVSIPSLLGLDYDRFCVGGLGTPPTGNTTSTRYYRAQAYRDPIHNPAVVAALLALLP